VTSKKVSLEADLCIIPEIGKPRSNPDLIKPEGRYQLMQAITDFLTNMSSMQPLLLVLEDLHDADKGTLDMLTHISRHLAGTRLLIVGT
jgi:predicted ATPase